MNQKVFHFLASPQTLRLLPFFLIFIVILTFGACLLKVQNFESFLENSQNLSLKTFKALDKKKSFDTFIQKHSIQSSLYFEDKLQSMTPLKREIEILENHLKHPLALQKENHQRRLNFLKGDQNRIELMCEDLLENGKMIEERLRMKHPVEIDGEDIKEILNLLEINPSLQNAEDAIPQMIITSFHLKNEPFGSLHEKQTINLQLCKRHFSPK